MNKTICELMGKHTIADCEPIGGNLYRFICPECGVSVIVSFDEIKQSILDWLNHKGYKDVKQIS